MATSILKKFVVATTVMGTAVVASGCAEKLDVTQQTATMTDKSVVDSNLFVDEHPGEGSKMACLAGQMNKDKDSGKLTVVFTACQAIVGKTRGITDTIIGGAQAAGSVMYGVAALKSAFAPVQQPAGNTTISNDSGSASNAVNQIDSNNQTNIVKTGTVSTGGTVNVGQVNVGP